MLRVIKDWRHDLPEEIWFDELLSADPAARSQDRHDPGLEDLDADLTAARAYFHAFCTEVDPERPDTLAPGDDDWLERIRVRSTHWLWDDPVVGEQLATRADALRRARADNADNTPGDAIGADRIDTRGRAVERWQLGQRGAWLLAGESGRDAAPVASPIIDIRCASGRLDLIPYDDFWATANRRPGRRAGARTNTGLGRDRGPGRRCRAGRAAHALDAAGASSGWARREDEPGRWDDEGPQHRVTDRRGLSGCSTPPAPRPCGRR